MHFVIIKGLKIDKKHLLTSICILCSISCGCGSSGKPCAHLQIESPKPVNGVIAVEENTTVNITFILVNVSCQNMSNFVIEIESKFNSSNSEEQMYTPYCDIIVQPSVCHSPANNKLCTCVSTNGPYRMTKTMTRTGNTMWRLKWKWSSIGDTEDDIPINFNITISPEFGVNITVKRSETLHHVTEIRTTVRMPTMHITLCRLIKYSEQDSTRMTSDDTVDFVSRSSTVECSTDYGNALQYFVKGKRCLCHVFNTTLDLIFTVFFYNVTIDDTGKWQVAVSTQTGNGYFNFSIPVEENISFINGNSSEQQANHNVLLSVFGIGITVIIMAATVSSIAVIMQKGIKKHMRCPFIYEYTAVADSVNEMRVRNNNFDRQGISAISFQASFPIINLDRDVPANYTDVHIARSTL